MSDNIAHDLRTPLSIILGYTEALSDGKASQGQWQALFARYREAYPDLAAEWERRLVGALPGGATGDDAATQMVLVQHLRDVVVVACDRGATEHHLGQQALGDGQCRGGLIEVEVDVVKKGGSGRRQYRSVSCKCFPASS